MLPAPQRAPRRDAPPIPGPMLRCWLLLVLVLVGCRPVPAPGDAVRAMGQRGEATEHAMYAGSGLPEESARAEAGAELVVPDGSRSRRHLAPGAVPACAAAPADACAGRSPDRHCSAFSLPGGELPYYATAPPGLSG